MLSSLNIYYFIPFHLALITYNLTISDLVHIDLFFSKDDNNTNSSTKVGTVEASSPSMTPQPLTESVDSPLCHTICIHKSTKSRDFAYSCYSLFLIFIHNLCESTLINRKIITLVGERQ